MEAILVFDYNNYLIYDKHNKQFLGKIAEIAKSNKLVSNNEESVSRIACSLQHNTEEFNNLIVLIFGPYVASVRILRDDCPKVDLFEDKQIQLITRGVDYMFLLIFKSGNEKTLIEMNRKLEIFVDLVKLFYGVSINELESDGNNDVRSYLEFNFRCWEQSKDRPLFKLNAQERLIINDQIKNELDRMLLHLIKEINEEPLLKEIPFQSMIYVNDMLICSHKRSNSPRILHSDLILLTLMVKTYFCCLSDLEDKTLISSDSDYIASDEEYCNHLYCDKNNGLNNRMINDKNLLSFDYFTNNDITNRSKSIMSRLAESDRFLFDDCEHQLIFLHSYIDRTNLIPFLVRLMRVNNEVMFVTLSELPSTFLYYYANKLLLLFNGLQYSNTKYFGFLPLSQLENSIRKMDTCLDFVINSNEKRNNKRNMQNAKLLKQKLDRFMKSDFRKYVLAHRNYQLSSQLEALAGSICLQLKELANLMVFTHHHNQLNTFRSITINKLSKLKRLYLYQLRDYLSFLWVKSRRNIPIEPYCNLIPNLILFIYVDRNQNEFIWSSDQKFGSDHSACSQSRESMNYMLDYQSVIYNLIDKSYHLLKTTQSMQNRWTEKNLIFNYAIWFEDHTGKLLNCNDKKSFDLKSVPNLKENNFIDQIVAQCYPTYKLIKNRELNESLTSSISSSSSSSSDYLILRCYEIFYIQIKNNSNQKVLCSDKVSNEERFQVGNSCLSSLDLIQARRLGKKISSTNSLTTK